MGPVRFGRFGLAGRFGSAGSVPDRFSVLGSVRGHRASACWSAPRAPDIRTARRDFGFDAGVDLLEDFI
eukprot:61709-Pyramimonas_sp.AAC.1